MEDKTKELMELQKSRLIIHVPRELDDHHAREIIQKADNLLETHWIRTIVFDFEETGFMDSAGVGMILGRYKKMQYMGGKVEACAMNDRIYGMLKLSGLAGIITMKRRAGR